MFGGLKVTFSKQRVVSGSYFFVWAEQYSDDLRNPKKAVVTAAQSMTLSACGRDDDWSEMNMALSFPSVTGIRLGDFLD